jgi:hypothetical protein
MEILALVIDRGTSAEVSKINYEIGRSVYWWGSGSRFFNSKLSDRERLENDLADATRSEKNAKRRGESGEYESLLREYVELKLHLHNMRKTLYYPYDTYTPPDDYKRIMTRCDELKQQIKDKRRIVFNAAWGGLEPARKPTDYDKPILSSFEERTCNFWCNDDSEEGGHDCPFNGEHWYLGKAYCRPHFHETRKSVRTQRRIESLRSRARHWRRHIEETAQTKVERPTYNEVVANYVVATTTVPVELEACTDPFCPHDATRHAHLPAGGVSMLDSRPPLPHSKANGRKGVYFA